MTIPVSLASLTLINQTADSFSGTLFSLFGDSFSLGEQFSEVRKLYEIENVQNRVAEGKEPFPENRQSLRNGISVEFRCLQYSSLHVGVAEACIFQECIVPVPWCRGVCSQARFVQNRSGAALRK